VHDGKICQDESDGDGEDDDIGEHRMVRFSFTVVATDTHCPPSTGVISTGSPQLAHRLLAQSYL
jgi:hypothetical protein